MDPAGEAIEVGFNRLLLAKKRYMRPNLFSSGAFHKVERAVIMQD
jgi:hypothetical protein